ncbi:TRAP transporter small permease [Bacillus sp. JCM 19041]|uniref:TRAP transporter small permease n=1 Tax=Bacillus sp. JCM 19041 TaxID=1460637 RepID=UPI0006CF7CF1
MNTYIKIIDSINNGIKYLVSIMLVVLAILVVLQVTTRFVINVPLSWTEEIARYLMIYIVFLGSGLAMRYNQHIAIDFLLDVIKQKNKERLQKIILWISAIFCVMLAYYGAKLTYMVIGQSTPTLQYSMAWAYAAIPLGALVMLVNIIALLVRPNKESESTDRIVGESK